MNISGSGSDFSKPGQMVIQVGEQDRKRSSEEMAPKEKDSRKEKVYPSTNTGSPFYKKYYKLLFKSGERTLTTKLLPEVSQKLVERLKTKEKDVQSILITSIYATSKPTIYTLNMSTDKLPVELTLTEEEFCKLVGCSVSESSADKIPDISTLNKWISELDGNQKKLLFQELNWKVETDSFSQVDVHLNRTKSFEKESLCNVDLGVYFMKDVYQSFSLQRIAEAIKKVRTPTVTQ